MSVVLKILCQQPNQKIAQALLAAPPPHGTLQFTLTERAFLTAFDLRSFDQIWLSSQPLTAAEQVALTHYLNAGGAVYLSGGRLRNAPPRLAALCTEIPFKPQWIRCQHYYDWTYPGRTQEPRDHPLFHSKGRNVQLTPHVAGAVNLPVIYPQERWPMLNGQQPRPQAIAWGNDGQQQRPLVVLYDGHIANTGRIVIDALRPSSDLAAYYGNIALWLANPEKQQLLRHETLWALYKRPSVQQCDLAITPPYLLGAIGRQVANVSLLDTWLLDSIPTPQRQRLAAYGLIQPAHPLPIALSSPLEELLLGEILWMLKLINYQARPDELLMAQLITAAVIDALYTFEPHVRRLKHILNADSEILLPTKKAAELPPFPSHLVGPNIPTVRQNI